MNNLKQKNVIYKRDIKDVLPHTGKGDSIALASNSNITDARLNNAFQQLVNNDLYLENRLVAGLNYQPGPEGTQSESMILALPDGSKRWVNSDDYTKPLQIYKKVEVPLSQSIGLVRGAAVNFIAPVGDAVFAAFSDKLMYDRGAGLVECADSAGASVVAVGYCDGSNGTFFVSDTSVYRLAQFMNADGGVAYRLQKLNSADMSGLKCVQYDAADSMLYVGGDSGFIARGHCSDRTTSVYFAQDIKFCADDVYGGASDTNRYVSDIAVNALQMLDQKDYSVNSGKRQTNILAATDGGMFRSDTRFFLEVKTSGTLAGKTCVDVVQHEGVIYVLTSDGYVYRQTDAGNMTFQKYPSSQAFTFPTGFASHSSGLYVACATGVYRYVQLGNDPEIQREYAVSDVGAVAVATLFSERIVFAAVDGTVYYYSTPGKVRSIRFDGCTSIRQIVAQVRSGTRGSFDVYVIGENSVGSEQVFAAYIGFDSGKVTNFDEIDGEELVFEDVESVVCDGSCYCFSDGVIYNQTTGQQKRLGDVRVHQMEYLSSNGSLALATDAGFQILNAETFDLISQTSDGELSNTWFASQSGSTACFATLQNIYVAHREGASLNTVLVGGVGDGYRLYGVATDGDKIYAIGKASDSTDGVISSASLYYVRNVYIGSDEGGDETIAHLEFPVMPFMAEATSAAALGISAGQAYRLAYDGSSPSYESVTFPGISDDTPISAFCMVGSQIFVATSGEIRQYECSAAEFDPRNMGDLVAISSTTLANVNRLVYSGTDTTFDMRIYAKQGENGLSVYTPSFANISKYTPTAAFSDFIMYNDCVEAETDDDNDMYYAVMLGIGTDTKKLHIISSVISGQSDPWTGSETVSALPAIEEEYDGVPQSDRTPYQVFYTDDVRVYVAYTAKIQEDLYSDYILAIDTADLLHGEIGDTLDFAQLGRYSSLGQAGVSRFTGFNIPGSDEDIDIIATCYKDELSGYTLATFKVDANIAGEKLADVRNCTYFQPDPYYRCFQPDCIKLKIQSNIDTPITDDYYIAVPTITPDGNILRTYIFKYINSSNTCDPRGYADVEGVGSAGISSVYVSRFMQESETTPLLVVVDTRGRAFNVKAVVGEVVQWSDDGIVSQVLDGTQFQRIVRCGYRQLVGFDKARSFVYDFQSGAKYIQSIDYISNVYATDTDDGRNYMLIQHTGDKEIFSVDPVQSLQFSAVTELGNSNKTLIKANDTVFVIAWDSTEKIYQENVGGGFTKIAEGGFDKPAGGYKDAQIFYGRISDRSNNDEYYVFLLKQSGGVDVYAMVGSSSEKTLQKVYEFENPIYDETDPNTYLAFSYIQYAGYGSDFDTYSRKQAFNGIDHYDWPILIVPGGAQEYMYLDFQARPNIRCTQLEPLAGSQYVSLGKDGETVYCVKMDGDKAVVYSIDGTNLHELGRYDINVASDYAWLTCGKCVFRKTDGGIIYHDGDAWREFGNDTYDFAGRTEDGLYYFVKADSSLRRNLYKSVSIAVYPIRLGPAVSEITYVGLAIGSSPVRLASGRTYAGLVCQDGTGIRNLCILWPTDEYVTSPAGPGDPGAVMDYSVYACPASFNEFPDGRVNTMEIVPVGNYLDEIIAYEGSYLHIAHIVESKLITDQTGYSVIPVINTLPWTDLGASFGDGICASAKLNGRRYVTSGTGLSSFTEGSSGVAMKILSPIMKADGVNARSFYEIGQNAFLIATDKGVYRYQHLEGTPVVGRMSPGTGYNIAQVTSYSFGSDVDTYLIANMLDGYLYSSENCRIWKKQFRPAPASAQLRAVYPKNASEWYFGASTGLYKSTYQYSEVDDLAKFTEDDLYSLYAELLSSDISSRCEDEMSQHELDGSYALGHLSSLMYDINENLLSVNFGGLQSSGWQHHTNTYSAAEYSVSNDIVFEQFWGSNADWNLTLSVENQFISAANAKFTYLFRRWMSGITEIYVHIPTTNTYYINHVASTPNYNIDENTTELSAANVTQFGRNKMVFKHNPNEPGVYTTVKLALSRYVFFIDQMLEVQACGNSLPLKIYKETITENGSDNDFEAAQYFNSYIAPTVLMSTAQTEDDYVLNFACFGADEQVIKLQFIDTINKFDQEYCRLVFDSNGLNTDPDSFVKQHIRLDGQSYSLRRNQYQWPQDQRLFAGWTFTPNPAVNVDTSTLNGFYNDKQQITSTEIVDRYGPVMSGQDVKLYAVWITYQFGASDTTILMSPQPGKTTFRLGSADMINDQRIGDKMIIKFEEVD